MPSYEIPLGHKNLIQGKLHTDHGQPGAMIVRPGDPSRSVLVQRLLDGEKRMPTVGVLRRDTDAIAAVTRWIDGLPIPADLEPVPQLPGDDAPVEAPPVETPPVNSGETAPQVHADASPVQSRPNEAIGAPVGEK